MHDAGVVTASSVALVGTKAKPIHRLGVGSTKKKAAFFLRRPSQWLERS